MQVTGAINRVAVQGDAQSLDLIPEVLLEVRLDFGGEYTRFEEFARQYAPAGAAPFNKLLRYSCQLLLPSDTGVIS